MNMISKHLQSDLKRQMERMRSGSTLKIKRNKRGRSMNNLQVIKQMNNNTMHISASTKDQVLSLIEQSKDEYRMKLGCKGSTLHADPVSLSIAFGMNTISIELTYSRMTSPIGFPFHRLICKLRLDGGPITLKQLKEQLNND
jgi:hypothetical protein